MVRNRPFHAKTQYFGVGQGKYWEIAVGQGLKVPSHDIFALEATSTAPKTPLHTLILSELFLKLFWDARGKK